MRLACVATVLVVLFECAAIPLARADTPDATLEFSAGSAAAGVGYTWASGTLDYGGESHLFRVNGLGVINTAWSSACVLRFSECSSIPR